MRWRRKLRRPVSRFTSWCVDDHSTPDASKSGTNLEGQARDYAAERGIIIADTKFEFGLDPETNSLVLVDEVLTPDSSRFWPADKYQVGRAQESYDKVCLGWRKWMIY